jgi:hypothetical protein
MPKSSVVRLSVGTLLMIRLDVESLQRLGDGVRGLWTSCGNLLETCMKDEIRDRRDCSLHAHGFVVTS